MKYRTQHLIEAVYSQREAFRASRKPRVEVRIAGMLSRRRAERKIVASLSQELPKQTWLQERKIQETSKGSRQRTTHPFLAIENIYFV